MSYAALEAAIEDFADIGDFIDQPVKTYSSGMFVRLAFAVAAQVRPDILIVDEALAVGDAAFQAKAMTRIQQILARGTTLLFVGHDLNALRAFCQRGILLENGRMAMLGAPEEVIEEYLFRVHAKAAQEGQAKPIRIAEGFRSEDGGVLGLAFPGGARHLALNYGDAIEIGNDAGILDANLNVTGDGNPNSQGRFIAPVTFKSDADVDVPAMYEIVPGALSAFAAYGLGALSGGLGGSSGAPSPGSDSDVASA